MSKKPPDRFRCEAYPEFLKYYAKAIGAYYVPKMRRCKNLPTVVFEHDPGNDSTSSEWVVGLCEDCASRAKRMPFSYKRYTFDEWCSYGNDFQSRVGDWMLECFGDEISKDKLERCHRFLEEAMELVQALDMPKEHAQSLVEYTYSREAGKPSQEVGGVLLTLMALCNANGISAEECGERELNRAWAPENLEKIRKKQASKPKGSALPQEYLGAKTTHGTDPESSGGAS